MVQTGEASPFSLDGPPATVLGILNVTPDSFSDGGRFMDLDAAVAHAETMIAEGADIIDIGGESTRPGAAPVDPQEEAARVVPVIEAVSTRCRVAVDTRNAGVAEAGVAAGATIINDISASLAPVAATLGVGWIAMHMQGSPRSMQQDPQYEDVVAEVAEFLDRKANEAAELGVSEIWIDPGIGFGKSLDHNLQILAHIDKLVGTGWPVVIGTSRKSMLGQLIARSDGADQQPPPEDRLVGSVTTAAYAMLQGVAMVRVHDVKAAKQAATVVAGKR
ncbi:MAG: dihydropteroate synthase [Actinomycetota bacterium]